MSPVKNVKSSIRSSAMINDVKIISSTKNSHYIGKILLSKRSPPINAIILSLFVLNYFNSFTLFFQYKKGMCVLWTKKRVVDMFSQVWRKKMLKNYTKLNIFFYLKWVFFFKQTSKPAVIIGPAKTRKRRFIWKK